MEQDAEDVRRRLKLALAPRLGVTPKAANMLIVSFTNGLTVCPRPERLASVDAMLRERGQ